MKKSSRKRSASTGVAAQAPGSVFWVIDLETPGMHSGSATAHGPFISMHHAEGWLRRDAEETYLSADKSIRDIEAGDKPWAEPMLIVEVKRRVRQVPRAHVTVTLEDCDTPNTRDDPRRSEA